MSGMQAARQAPMIGFVQAGWPASPSGTGYYCKANLAATAGSNRWVP